MSRPKSPCGTPAAYARHLRNREQPDQACVDAHTEDRRARKGLTSKPAQDVTVQIVNGSIVFTVPNSDDARMIAAAVGDRAYSMRQSAHKTTGATLTASRHEKLRDGILRQLRAIGAIQ